jgi:hypothetical protein
MKVDKMKVLSAYYREYKIFVRWSIRWYQKIRVGINNIYGKWTKEVAYLRSK